MIPFESQMVNYSSRTDSLKAQQKPRFDVFEAKSMVNKKFLASPKTHCDSSNCNWSIWTQKVPNEALLNWLQMLLIFTLKYFV